MESCLPCLTIFFTLTSKVHNHMTRQASENNFFMGRVTKSSTQQFIKVSGPNIWKTLPPEQSWSLGQNLRDLDETLTPRDQDLNVPRRDTRLLESGVLKRS